MTEPGSAGLTSMRDILDNEVVSADDRLLGRVADVRAAWQADGSLDLEALRFGPQALLGRVSSRLTPLARWLLRDRFEREIPLSEVESIGLAVTLRGPAEHYPLGAGERWIAQHVLRYLSGPRW